MTQHDAPILRVRNLHTHFRLNRGSFFNPARTLKAVNDVSFDIHQGEVLSLVGESGCGKTTVGRTLTRLQNATSGTAEFDGKNILSLNQTQFRPFRKRIQIIFQDPFASLNPRLTIESTLAEPLFIHKLAQTKTEAKAQINTILEQVGLDPSVLKRYPHEFSGGQRQRIGIARVMILRPSLIIADEPVSALDVSIQAQILNLIKRLQQESKIALLFISHDLSVVRHISDRIAIMHQGSIVETGTKSSIFDAAQHPYTKKLLASVPRLRIQNQ